MAEQFRNTFNACTETTARHRVKNSSRISGYIVIHNPGYIANQISKALCDFRFCSRKLRHPLNGCRIKLCIETFTRIQCIQCLPLILNFTENRFLHYCINGHIHAIIHHSLQSQITIFDNTDHGILLLNLRQQMDAFGIDIPNRLIQAVTSITNALYRQSCILSQLIISRRNGLWCCIDHQIILFIAFISGILTIRIGFFAAVCFLTDLAENRIR